MRRAAKKDRNHPEIVDALRKAGRLVLDLGAVGNGCPDLLVLRTWVGGDGYPCRQLYLLEVKDGGKPPSARKLTPDQEKFHQEWPVKVVTSVEDALREVGVGV